MKPLATHKEIKDLGKDHAVEKHVATGQGVTVKFYPGLGYAPCIERDLSDGTDQTGLG